METLIKEIDNIEFKDLPDMEDISIVHEGVGRSSGYELVKKYDHLIDRALLVWQYHFEFLNLGYAAFVTFADFCRKAFPGIDDGTITRMVAGIDVILFQPDMQLRKLAMSAITLEVTDFFKDESTPAEIITALGENEAGKKWLEQYEQAQKPWFYMSSGTGWYHDHYCWLDRPEIPFMAIKSYIKKAQKGESLERPTQKLVEERDRIVAEYGSLLRTQEDKDAYNELLAISQKVFPFVEEHTFYVEHWSHSLFYGKMRELSAIFVNHGMIKDIEDIWYLNRFEIGQALYDLVCAWGTGVKACGPSYWPQEIEWRKGVIEKFREYTPPPALGMPPEVVTEPFTITLWGITTDRLSDWLDAGSVKAEDMSKLQGHPGSPGIVEGIARVVRSPADLGLLQEGEILVAPTTSPSWAPIFVKVKAVVTDVGGIMSHAAIVCREYGLPAVVGSGYATAAIKTGQRIKVDGHTGKVEILQD